MRILIADDEPRVRSALRLLLEQQFSIDMIEEVTNTQELQGYIRNQRPDVLLLGWTLPGSLSKNLLMSLRNFYPGLFIIVLDSKPQTRRTALAEGANIFVSKNEPPEKLLAAIKEYNVTNYMKDQAYCKE